MTVSLLVRHFPEALRQEVKAAAAMERKTMAQVIVEAVTAHLAARRTRRGK